MCKLLAHNPIFPALPIPFDETTNRIFKYKIFTVIPLTLFEMQATGIDGIYRMTCVKVMEVLRRNKDSLMAVLEAFVYDPLLNWRLVEGMWWHASAYHIYSGHFNLIIDY